MKRKAKILSLFLAVIFVFAGMTVSVYAAGEGMLTVSKYDGFAAVTSCSKTASGTVDIPSTFEGLPVTVIYDSAFADCNKVTQVNIPASVTKVGSNAFDSCTALKKVVFSGTDCTLGDSAFVHCGALTDIVFPSQLTEISDNAFYDCGSLVSVNIPATVEIIGEEAFRICKSITSFNIPASVKIIRKNAFIGCSSVTEYNVAAENTVYSSNNGVIYGPYDAENSDTDKTLVQYPMAKTDASYTVQAGTLVIGDYSFGGNKNIKTVVLPEGLKRIDSYAFNECTALSGVVIPAGVTEIGSLAFGKCSALESVTIPASVTDFSSAFYMSGVKNVVISEGVKQVSPKAFEGCKSLESVKLPSTLETIRMGAFDGCTALEEIEIPENVTSIEVAAFGVSPTVKLIVTEGSYAHDYAVANSLAYSLKSDETPEESTKPSTTEPTTKPSTTEPTTKKTIVSVSVANLPDKTSYYYKETINTKGLEIEVLYSDGSTETVKSGFEISPEVCTERGAQNVTVEYMGFTDEFRIDVSFTWWQWIIWIFALGFFWY